MTNDRPLAALQLRVMIDIEGLLSLVQHFFYRGSSHVGAMRCNTFYCYGLVADIARSKSQQGIVIKGIDQSLELRGEIKLIRSVMTNWRLGNFFYLILNGPKISKKPIVAAK